MPDENELAQAESEIKQDEIPVVSEIATEPAEE